MRTFPWIFLLTALPQAHAQDTMDLLNMSLEELMQVTVTTVSKKEERLTDAPGVVSVFSAEDIRTFGSRNLRDVLLRIPNFHMFDSYAFNGLSGTLRAGATQHLNNHILYLINGRPLRESQNGGRQSDINLLFPLSSIERIEVIRGPGSVLYGSNAFSGTINIITKQANEKSDADISVSLGSYGLKTLEASAFTGDSEVNFGGSYKLLDQGGAYISAKDEGGNLGSTRLARKGYFTQFNAHYQGFWVEGIKSEIKLPNISGQYKWTGLGDWTHQREYLTFGYQHEFNDNWQLSAYYSKNMVDMSVVVPSEITYSSFGYMYELSLNGKINDQTTMVVGVLQDHINGDLSMRGGKQKAIRRSVYGQFDYFFSENTKLTAGLQINKPEQGSAHSSPRLALVHRVNDNWTAKALFAEAYRSPFNSEMHFESSFLKGDENLKPETIKTTELQVIYNRSKTSIATTVYHSQSYDLIGRKTVDGVSYFTNTDQEITYRGIELEASWKISPQLKLHANASYQQTEDDLGAKDVMIAPNEMVKFGLSYQADNGVLASFWHNYLGDVSKLEDIPGSAAQVVNPESKAVNLLSANLEANVGTLLKAPKWQSVQLSVSAENLLNEDVWFPELGRKRVNSYPQSYHRSIHLKLSVSF